MATSNARLQRSDSLNSESSSSIVTLPDSDTTSSCHEKQRDESSEKDNDGYNSARGVHQCEPVIAAQKKELLAANNNDKKPRNGKSIIQIMACFVHSNIRLDFDSFKIFLQECSHLRIETQTYNVHKSPVYPTLN